MLVQSRTPKKSFVFLLEEKIGRAQIKKCEQNFSLVWRALASGGGAGQFRSKWVRAKFRIEHQTQKPRDICRAIGMDRSYMSAIKSGKKNITLAILGIILFIGIVIPKLTVRDAVSLTAEEKSCVRTSIQQQF